MESSSKEHKPGDPPPLSFWSPSSLHLSYKMSMLKADKTRGEKERERVHLAWGGQWEERSNNVQISTSPGDKSAQHLVGEPRAAKSRQRELGSERGGRRVLGGGECGICPTPPPPVASPARFGESGWQQTPPYSRRCYSPPPPRGPER